MNVQLFRWAVVMALAPTSCATPSASYVEPNLPPGEAAVVMLTPYAGRSIEVSQIDETLVGLTNRSVSTYWKRRGVELAPGAHTLDLYLIARVGGVVKPQHKRISLHAEAGHVYQVRDVGEDLVINDVPPQTAPPQAPPVSKRSPQAPAALSWSGVNQRVEELTRQGRYEEAAGVGMKAVRMAEQLFGAEHPSVALALYNVAYLDEALGRYAEAEPLLVRALSLLERSGSADLSSLTMCRAALGAAYQALSRYEEAEQLDEQVFSVLERTRGRTHPETMAAAANLAAVYVLRGRYDVAHILYQRVLAFQEKAFGRNDPRLWPTVQAFAKLCTIQGQYGKADALYQRAVRLSGPKSPNTATSLLSYARLLRDLGRAPEAEKMEAKAAKINAHTPR